jgi:AcrR family transcriptional regulator
MSAEQMELVRNLASREPAEVRREKLIEATIDVLALRGYSSLTVGDVAKLACVSHGSVFVYFPTKEDLLRATLTSLEFRYSAKMATELAKAQNDARKIILAIIETDLSPDLATPRLVRAWASFRSEARDMYESIALVNDDRDFEVMCQAFTVLSKSGAEIRAQLLRATLDGLLRQLLLGRTDLKGARQLAFASLSVILPEHFGPDVGT